MQAHALYNLLAVKCIDGVITMGTCYYNLQTYLHPDAGL